MEFEEFKAVYDKFIKNELPNFEYPDVSAYTFFHEDKGSPFEDVIFYLKIENAPFADRLSNRFMHIEGKYSEADLWDKLRKVYNRNIAEAELIKQKYLKTLNESKYEGYFNLVQWICGALFETEAGKEYFKNSKDNFIRIVVSVLAGEHNALSYIIDNQDQFNYLLNSEIENYLQPKPVNAITGETIKKEYPEGLFFSRMNTLRNYSLREISEYEKIVYTLYSFESIALHEAINEAPPEKIPTYEEERDKSYNSNNPRNSGRKYDPSAPQKAIEIKVEKLANKNKFQDAEGKPKPTSIRDEIAKNYPQLMGDIKERALFTRVKKALSMFHVDEDGKHKRIPF